MASSPISGAVGGIWGQLRQKLINVSVDGDVVFDGTVAIGTKEVPRVHQAAMVASATAGGIFSWQNPESVPIIVLDAILEWTTQSAGACAVSLGVAADGTTLSSTLISGQSVASAAGLARASVPRRVDAAGGSNDYITASVASGTVTGLVGRVYIEYVKVV